MTNTDMSTDANETSPWLGGGAIVEWPPADNKATSAPPVEIKSRRVERLQLAALLLASGLLYLWDLGASGYANDFYAAAVQAGTQSWKAFFFGSFDSSNFITVDKPPAALWPMELSGRIFGFNSWSMLVPQALEGVLTVWLLYATVRRWTGHTAGLIAGALLAITPVAVLMFRFNNPDALMTLLIVLAAYCTTRAIEAASTRWLLLAGAVMGFSFLAKGLQPFTVLPALALAYLVCAPTSLRRRLVQLLGAGAALIAGAGWWVLAVDLTPVSSRPYIGGSGDNTALGLAFGYNGLDRLSTSGGPGGGGGGTFSGATGLGRLFNDLNGGQIAWLLPAAGVLALATIVVSGRRPRTDRTYAALILWGGWALITGAVLSFAGGIIHTYYSVELAPAVAALVGIGAVTLWRAREKQAARVGLAATAAATALWGYALLRRTPDFHSWLAYVVLVAGLVAGALLLVPPGRARRAVVVTSAAGLALAAAGGPAAYALNTADTPQQGSIPSAGPAVSGAGGFGGGGGPGRGRLGTLPAGLTGVPGGFPGGPPNGGLPGGVPGGFEPGSTQTGGTQTGGTQTGGTSRTGFNRLPGSPGGSTANAALSALLKKTTTTWAAATVGSQAAGPLELASGKAVMAIGGFSGSDATPTLAAFEKLVANGKIAYFVSGGFGGFGGRGGQSTGSQIATWVAANYTSTTVGGSTVYDLTKART